VGIRQGAQQGIKIGDGHHSSASIASMMANHSASDVATTARMAAATLARRRV
jgi:hypothetical protein